MKKVNCSHCNKEFKIGIQHYNRNIRMNYNFVCSKDCPELTIEKKFWSKVNKIDNINDCWEWTASGRNKAGYGSIKYNDKTIDAHRLSYMMFTGNYNLTSKDYICHRCDNPKCVNPHHLFLGNHSINMKDAYDKGRIIVPIGVRFKKGHIPYNKK